MARSPSIRSLALGAVVVAIGCAGGVDDGSTTGDAPAPLSLGATYTLVRAGSNKCLDVQGGGNADFTTIQQWTCNGTGAQLFRADDLGGGNVRLVNPQSGKCVDLNAAGTSDGTKVQLYTCNGTVAQSFALQDAGNGRSSLVNPHSGKCIDVSGASNADGAAVQLWTCNGTVAQQWAFSGSGGGGGPPPGWKLTWSDEFNGARGAIDGSKWGFDTGNSGWGNNELEYYTNRTDNALVDGNGNLAIIARAESYGGSSYTSARINTGGRFTQAYGRFEARIKLPSGKGIWPAFWILGNNIGSVGWPSCGELDIMEAVGDFSVNHGSCHGPGYSGGADLTATWRNPGGSLANDFHVYALEWQPNQVQFFVDGNLYETRTPADIPGKTWVYDHPFFIILNVAVGGNWPGSPDGSTVFPQTMLVDYVRVYTKS